jgi:hypothetical protein
LIDAKANRRDYGYRLKGREPAPPLRWSPRWFERALILARTGEGRKRAQARGVRFGRPPKLTAYQRAEALQRLAAGETQTDIARSYGVSHVTIGRLEPSRPFEGASVAG